MASRSLLGPKITKMPFRFLVSTTIATAGGSAAKTDLTATNLGGRAQDVKDDFEWFRISRMHIYSLVDFASSSTSAGLFAGVTGVHMVAFDNQCSSGVTLPATVDQMIQFRSSEVATFYEKSHLHLSPTDLFAGGPLKWFTTTATGSFDASEASAGTVLRYIIMGTQPGTTLNISQDVICEGIVEFHTPVDPNVSRARRGELIIPRNIADDASVQVAKLRLEQAVSKATEAMTRT